MKFSRIWIIFVFFKCQPDGEHSLFHQTFSKKLDVKTQQDLKNFLSVLETFYPHYDDVLMSYETNRNEHRQNLVSCLLSHPEHQMFCLQKSLGVLNDERVRLRFETRTQIPYSKAKLDSHKSFLSPLSYVEADLNQNLWLGINSQENGLIPPGDYQVKQIGSVTLNDFRDLVSEIYPYASAFQKASHLSHFVLNRWSWLPQKFLISSDKPYEKWEIESKLGERFHIQTHWEIEKNQPSPKISPQKSKESWEAVLKTLEPTRTQIHFGLNKSHPFLMRNLPSQWNWQPLAFSKIHPHIHQAGWLIHRTGTRVGVISLSSLNTNLAFLINQIEELLKLIQTVQNKSNVFLLDLSSFCEDENLTPAFLFLLKYLLQSLITEPVEGPLISIYRGHEAWESELQKNLDTLDQQDKFLKKVSNFFTLGVKLNSSFLPVNFLSRELILQIKSFLRLIEEHYEKSAVTTQPFFDSSSSKLLPFPIGDTNNHLQHKVILTSPGTTSGQAILAYGLKQNGWKMLGAPLSSNLFSMLSSFQKIYFDSMNLHLELPSVELSFESLLQKGRYVNFPEIKTQLNHSFFETYEFDKALQFRALRSNQVSSFSHHTLDVLERLLLNEEVSSI
jgi:hypothetical protein